MFEKACNKYALMIIYRCKGKVLKKVKEMTREERMKKIEERRQKRLANPNTYTIAEQDGLYIIQIYNGCDMLLENKCYKKLGNALNQAKKWNAIER